MKTIEVDGWCAAVAYGVLEGDGVSWERTSSANIKKKHIWDLRVIECLPENWMKKILWNLVFKDPFCTLIYFYLYDKCIPYSYILDVTSTSLSYPNWGSIHRKLFKFN